MAFALVKTVVIPAHAGIQLLHQWLCTLDYSLRSPCGPPFGRSTRYALLSGLRRNDEKAQAALCLAQVCAIPV